VIVSKIEGKKHIVIGLGSGRSGTASLASLIDRQNGGLCFHEMNPSGAVFSGNPQSHLNVVNEFQSILSGGSRASLSIDYSRPMSVETYERLAAMTQVKLLGDIAYYYLNYVEDILAVVPGCKFVCIKRDREQTVDSWMKKSMIKRWPSLYIADRFKALITRTPFYTQYNHWQDHNGEIWKQDPVWDSCFPKFETKEKIEAIRLYWDYYYLEADRLQKLFPDNFRIFDIDDLSDSHGQKRILEFIGVDAGDMNYGEAAHLHQSPG